MRTLILALVSFALITCNERGEDSIRLIPKGFDGPVLILFSQSDGEPQEYENGKRLYRIPKDGVLKTQFEPNYGKQNHQFYFVDSTGYREEIPFVIVQDKELLAKVRDRSKIYAFAEQVPSEMKGYDPKLGKYTVAPTRVFCIGNLIDVEKSIREANRFTLENSKKFRNYIDQ